MILKNAMILTVNKENEILNQADLRIKDGAIVEIAPFLHEEDEVIIDLTGKVIMPGFINCHSHLPMSIFRSLAEEDNDRLKKYMFPIEGKFINKSTVKVATRFTLLEMIRSGQTTVADMYYYDHAIAEVCTEANVRSHLFETIIDEGGDTFNSELGRIEHYKTLNEAFSNSKLVSVGIAPHAPYSNSLENLINCKKIARENNQKMMIHVSEMAFESGEFRNEASVIKYLEVNDLLDEDTILVHCLYLSEADLVTISKYNCQVVHCPVSNAKGGRPIMDLAKMQQLRVNVSLGTDGAMSGNRMDMHSVMYFASKIHKHKNNSRGFLPNSEVIRMATINGAKALGIDHLVGSIEIGKQADLIVIDPQMINMLPNYDIEASIVNALDSSNIVLTMVNGKIIYQENEYKTLDINTVVCEFNQLTDEIKEYVNL